MDFAHIVWFLNQCWKKDDLVAQILGLYLWIMKELMIHDQPSVVIVT